MIQPYKRPTYQQTTETFNTEKSQDKKLNSKHEMMEEIKRLRKENKSLVTRERE
jgi:hypothetical protein